MPREAVELPCVWHWIFLFVINICVKKIPGAILFLVLFYIKCLTSFCYLFYVRNILYLLWKDFVVFCFVLHSVNLHIILWLGGVKKFKGTGQRWNFLFSLTLIRKLWHPLPFLCQMFLFMTLVHRLWSIVDRVGSLPRTQISCIICIIITIDLHTVQAELSPRI